jgi:glycosyltransferase involved in cell wall biosynthesis
MKENKNMRLLQITASKVWRGHEQQIVYYYDEFKNKIEHQVLLCTPDTHLSKIATAKKYNFQTLPFKSEYDLKWMKKINQIIIEDRIDVILIHNSTAHTMCVMSSLIYGWKTPMLFFRTLIKKVDTNFFRKWKYNYKGLKKIVCVSEAVKSVLLSAINDHSRLSIVGSATDLSEFDNTQKKGLLHKELGLESNTKIIANISAFVPFKDHITFVNSAELISKKIPNCIFILIGKGELEQEIKNYVNLKGLNDVVLFLGFRKDIPEIFPEFDLFLFTSKLEPTGGVLLESYASMIPIVASRAGGIPEVIIENKTGLLCEKENASDFAEAAIKILTTQNLKIELVENGYKHLKANFTKEIIANKMLEEISQVYLNSKK